MPEFPRTPLPFRGKGKALVARMERSVIREQYYLMERTPDFAALHPGYEIIALRNYVARCFSRSSRSSRRVNIASLPSVLRGHSASGRSQ
ncbi:hypothetical protein ACVIHI_006024 [Bradyrhizobium sp. USDA 4524]